MAKAYIKRLIKERSPLFALIHEFNMLPLRYIHHSWLGSFRQDSIYARLKSSRRAESRVSDWILSSFGLESDYFFDFNDEKRRLALIDTATLESLILITGIAICAPVISRIIDRKSLLPLKQSIGDNLYLFALKRARFLTGDMSYAAEDWDGKTDLKDHSIICGLKCLEILFSGEPESLTKRLLFKLPKNLTQNFKQQQNVNEHKERTWQILQKLMSQEIRSEWTPIFS